MPASSRVVSFLIPTILLCTAPQAAGAQSAEVDAYLGAQMEKLHIPGLSLVVARDGRILKQSSYGLASIEFSAAASYVTLYQSASATKSFTAAAVMMLVDEGRLTRIQDGRSQLRSNSRDPTRE